MFKIEKGIPLPDEQKTKYKETVSKMKFGDSFLVGTQTEAMCAKRAGAKLKIKLTCRKQNGTGYRIWRIK